MTDQIGQKRSWLGWALGNVSNILVLIGILAFVGKPHAEEFIVQAVSKKDSFIVETVADKVTKELNARIGEVETNQTIIQSDQASIKAGQRDLIESFEAYKIERRQEDEALLKAIEKLLQPIE